MPEIRHTPGPWHVDGRMIAPDSANVAICVMCDFDSFGGVHDAHNAEANGRLIAAAPELLRELKYARDELWEALHSSMTEKQFGKQFGTIDEAIAKATTR